MTERLYWFDAYLREFDAQVVDVRPAQEGCAVVLDKTAFYPTSGGQMHDRGVLGGMQVEDVVEENGEIVHVVSGQISKGVHVRCSVDWDRRFDFMQQHTAFHVLAQALLRVTGAQTLSSHLGEEVSTLELDCAEVDGSSLAAAEELANRVLWENRRVRCYLVDAARAARMPLRKRPQLSGPVRLVDIDGFDLDPCSGTHVATTGEVGLLKIVGKERLRGHVRFRFLAGRRALRDYIQKSAILEAAAAELTTGETELPSALRKLRRDLHSANKQLRATQERLLTAIRQEVLSQSSRSAVRVVQGLDGIDWTLVRKFAFQLLDALQGALIVAQSAPCAHVAVGTNCPGIDLRALVPEACALLGGKGGGQPSFIEIAGQQGERVPETVALLRLRVEELLTNGAAGLPGHDAAP
ncbi:MAG: alanyl-tRNA editing protein [Candidatus Oleimicrobiaceae bacterium]